MTEKRQLAINIIANAIYMVINYLITFLLTSYIVAKIGSEAQGFIGLCNNIVNYSTVITIALNSVSGRFIAIESHRGNEKKANEYFSSTLIADLFICIGLSLVFVPIAIKIDSLFTIPRNIVTDVRILFLLVFVNLAISVISNVLSVATFIKNKLYLASIANASASIMRGVTLLLLFNILPPSIIIVGISSILGSLLVLVLNIKYTHALCPELKVRKCYYSFSRVKELISSGIWNSISKVAQIFSDGLDLIISNIWIGAYEMGQLSIAYTIPTAVAGFLSMIISVFNPKLTEYYAKNEKEKIVYELKTNMKMTALFGNIIFFVIFTLGKDFFELWVPTADINMLYVIVMFATVSILVSSIVSPLSNVFLLTNNLKVNSLVWLVVSIFDTGIVLLMLNTTNFGVYAVAGVSKIVGSIVNIIFLPVYACKCLNISKTTFYPMILRYSIITVIMGLVLYLIRILLGDGNSWLLFTIRFTVIVFIGVAMNYMFLLNKNEQQYLNKVIKDKLRRL